MIDVGIILFPEVLRQKLGDDGAHALMEVIDASLQKAGQTLNETSTERLERRLSEVKADLEIRINNVKSDLEVKISNVKAELVRWMFIFWAGQIAATVALLTAFWH